MFAELLGPTQVPDQPSELAAQPKAHVANPPPRAALRAVQLLLSEMPGLGVLRDRGASDADLDWILRRLGRHAPAPGEGIRLTVERRTAVLTYAASKRLKGKGLREAVRRQLLIPTPDTARPTFKPDVGRISDPVRLPNRRWGYREGGTWWSSTTTTDRDGENGFRRVRDPAAMARLDAWARTKFAYLHPNSDDRPPGRERTHTPLKPHESIQSEFLSALAQRNYRITGAERIGEGSLRQKAATNLEALRLLHELDAAGRAPTVDEQSVLTRYCGWGAIPNVFADDDPAWDTERAVLRELLSQAELRAAEASTMNAHFTSVLLIDAIYNVLRRLGFGGGKILEPGAGTGLFIGRAPGEFAARSRWTAIESDRVTGRILMRLYPRRTYASPALRTHTCRTEPTTRLSGTCRSGGTRSTIRDTTPTTTSGSMTIS